MVETKPEIQLENEGYQNLFEEESVTKMGWEFLQRSQAFQVDKDITIEPEYTD